MVNVKEMIDTIKIIESNKIKPDPNQPRKTFDNEDIHQLAASLKSIGYIHPIMVDEKNVIIVGERRWRAAKIAGIKKIPCIVKKGLSKLQRMKMQSDEDVQDRAIPLGERDKFWYEIYKEGKFKSAAELARFLNVGETQVKDAFDRLDFLSESAGPVDVAPTVISETKGLPKKERVKLVKLAEKKDIGARRIRKYVSVIRKAPEPIKEKILKGIIEPEIAEKIIEKEDAPRLVREADVGLLICPMCKKKLRVFHREPKGHRLEEVAE